MLCIVIVEGVLLEQQDVPATSTVLKGSSARSGDPGSVLLHARVRATLMAAGLDLPDAGGHKLLILQG